MVELNEVLDRLKQGPSQSPQRVETSDTSGDETDASQGRRKFLSKKTYRMKKVYAATELGRFFVTGASDAANMPSHFYCRLCRKNVSVLTHGHHEVLRHFQGRRHFARDQRLRFETPGWRVLDFQGNPLTEDELERQRESIEKGPLVVRDREHPFAEDLISEQAGVIDPQLPILTKVSCLVDGLKMGGSYGLIEKLWAQFVLTTGPVKREVAWTRDEVLVGSVDFRNPFVSCLIHIVVLLLVNYHHRNAASNLVASGWVGKGSSFLWPGVRGAWRDSVGFIRTWQKGTFRRVDVDVVDRFTVDATHEVTVLGSVVAAVGSSASLVAIFGGSHVLADTYKKYLGSGYSHKLVEYPIFDLRLLKRCLQKVSSSVFGSLDPFYMTELILTRLKGAEHCDWMMSRTSLRRAIITGELSMPSLLEVVNNIVGVWPLIVVYLKETGRKTDGDSIVV